MRRSTTKYRRFSTKLFIDLLRLSLRGARDLSVQLFGGDPRGEHPQQVLLLPLLRRQLRRRRPGLRRWPGLRRPIRVTRAAPKQRDHPYHQHRRTGQNAPTLEPRSSGPGRWWSAGPGGSGGLCRHGRARAPAATCWLSRLGRGRIGSCWRRFGLGGRRRRRLIGRRGDDRRRDAQLRVEVCKESAPDTLQHPSHRHADGSPHGLAQRVSVAGSAAGHSGGDDQALAQAVGGEFRACGRAAQRRR